jgi:hypothetical protein
MSAGYFGKADLIWDDGSDRERGMFTPLPYTYSRRKKEEGRRKKEEGRRKKEEAVIAMVSAIKNVLTVGRGCYSRRDALFRPSICSNPVNSPPYQPLLQIQYSYF